MCEGYLTFKSQMKGQLVLSSPNLSIPYQINHLKFHDP